MNHRGIWLTATVLAVVVLLAQVAGAATRDDNGAGAQAVNASASATLTVTAPTVSLPEQASSVASNKSEAGLAKANESITTHGRTTTTTTNEVRANTPAGAPTDSTSGARPGWGCGDTNHTHSGPPGRPGATPPPNCKP
jgi:hypothetical protein